MAPTPQVFQRPAPRENLGTWEYSASLPRDDHVRGEGRCRLFGAGVAEARQVHAIEQAFTRAEKDGRDGDMEFIHQA
jgi:hypothetical protein